MSRRSAHLHVHGDTAPWLQPGKSCLPCHHRSALVAGDDVTRMRSRSQDKQSIGSLSWTKRLLSVWNVENIKVVKRVIVSVVGAPSYDLSHIASKRVDDPRRMNQVASESDRKSAMHLKNVVAASLCRGGLALLPAQIRRHSAVATTLRVHRLIRLSLVEGRGLR